MLESRQDLVEQQIRAISFALERNKRRVEEGRSESLHEVEGTKLARLQRIHELSTKIRLKTLVDKEIYDQLMSKQTSAEEVLKLLQKVKFTLKTREDHCHKRMVTDGAIWNEEVISLDPQTSGHVRHLV